MNRKIINTVKGFPAIDGDGVKLVRVLGHATVEAYSPFLMLDSFDSRNPADYTRGFPMHPHRGIETITYLDSGAIAHKDSLGNKGLINAGEVQWMTAGSGIMHEEMPLASERMLGIQLWLNLPAKDKMSAPAYKAITAEDIPEFDLDGVQLRLLSGSFMGVTAYQGSYLPLDYYALHLNPNAKISLETPEAASIVCFTLEGGALLADEWVDEKTAVSFNQGTQLQLAAGEAGAKILYLASKALDEPVAWGGPIVMNTEDELALAFSELRSGEFIKAAAQI